ncbi:MAG: tyrosine-type recombinase/integrase, partial [Candidatus Bathyarchaeales archaeon]
AFPSELIRMVGRAGFEPATPSLFIEKKRFNKDLEDFKLFCLAKLNLSRETVNLYVRKVRAFLNDRTSVSEKDIQVYIQKAKEKYSPHYVSNILSAFKAYFRDYKGLKFMDGYKHPQAPLKVKEEIEPEKVKRFIEAIDDIGVKCFALFLAVSGLRKSEVWSLRKSDINRELRAIIPNCHSGKTKHSGISFYNEEAEKLLLEFEKSMNPMQKLSDRLIPIGSNRFFYEWQKAKKKSGIILKPKDLRDFFSQEMGKALIPDRFIDIYQGRAPKNVLAKHYTPQGIKLLREIYDKANLKILEPNKGISNEKG